MPEWDYRLLLELLVLLVTTANSAAIWLRKPGEQAAEAVKVLKEKTDKDLQDMQRQVSDTVGKLQGELRVLQERIQHMPTDEELAQLKGDVSTIKAEVKGVSDLLVRVEHQNTLIHQHLLNNAR